MERKHESATYIHGHHASVLRSHTWRTAANSASYLLPHLRSDMRILDIGCGPGTITVDLARYVPDGHITGLECAGDVLAQARSHAAEQGVSNVDFVVGDANALEYGDGSFDVVVCHQLLQHVRDPVGILREMRRVAKVGGIVAARESDFAGFVFYPELERRMDTWRAMYLAVARANGGEPNAGRVLHAWAKRAGFSVKSIRSNSSTWCYSQPEEIAWWSGLWAERTVKSAFASTAIQNGLATKEELEKVSQTWREWGEQEDAWFSVLHGEVLCIKEE
ncbi:hypothetical protein V502_01082 [Pseudogymnoascus sp. VKM F-4520 (FW-2644)]|nr:hypothetical protein V502_01082 [Pseudogymnoascus sp. VKM F-4520 (FW-2644)]